MHGIYGLSDLCDYNLVTGILESAKRSFSTPVAITVPVTPNMIFSICQTFAPENANLSDLCTAAI